MILTSIVPGDFDEGVPPAFPVDGSLHLIVAIEHEIDRRFEPLGDFGRVRSDLQVGRDDRHHRRDLIAAAGAILVAGADHANARRVDSEFLVCFAQCGFHGVLAAIDAASREGDLARMGAHAGGAMEQQHAGTFAFGDGDQHGGGLEGLDLVNARIDPQRGRPFGMSRLEAADHLFEQGAHSGISPNRMPPLLTLSPSPASAISASCPQVLRFSRASVPLRTPR